MAFDFSKTTPKIVNGILRIIKYTNLVYIELHKVIIIVEKHKKLWYKYINKTKKRSFQVSDMLTVIDKLDYKRKNNIPFTKAETFFFRGKDFRHIINLLKNKRI